MHKVKNNLTNLLDIKIEITRGDEKQEWGTENVSPEYALQLLQTAAETIGHHDSQTQLINTQLECTDCGMPVEPNDNYCADCGAYQEK